MVLTIFMTLFTCVSGVVGAYVCTHCCCLCGGNSSSNSANTAFKERIKYLTNLAVKEWMRIDVENMQRQYVAIENAKSSFRQSTFDGFNNSSFREPEPATVTVVSVKTAGDDEAKRKVQSLEDSKERNFRETKRVGDNSHRYLGKGLFR